MLVFEYRCAQAHASFSCVWAVLFPVRRWSKEYMMSRGGFKKEKPDEDKEAVHPELTGLLGTYCRDLNSYQI